jgi:DNA modification methylase
VKIKDLTPNKNNPRQISPERLEMLKASLERFGDLSGFVFNRRSNTLVSGHQRQKLLGECDILIEKSYGEPTACRTVEEGYVVFGFEKIKYRVVDADEKWETEALIAANKHGGEWDLPGLQKLIRLPEINLRLTGFTPQELPKLGISLSDEKETKTSDETTTTPKISNVNLGDLFHLGSHRLLCGDSTDPLQVARLIAQDKPDVVLTDPPYGLADKWSGGTWASDPMYADAKKWDQPLAQDFIELLIKVAPVVILWGGNYYRMPPSRCWLSWIKTQQMETMADFELAWTNLDKPAKAWSGARNSEGKRSHPTQKPVALMEWVLAQTEGKIVYDPFLGSGTTLIACEINKTRTCLGSELSPDYCALILNRWAILTGEDPIREDGVPWSQIKQVGESY